MKKDINIKRNLLKTLENIDGDLNELSLKDIITQFSKDVSDYDNSIIEREQSVIDEYTGAYLKHINLDGKLYDKEVELFHINGLEVCSYTTEWERTYALSGERIYFADGSFFKRKFDPSHVYSSYTEKDLANCIKITKEEYDSYDDKFESLNSILSEIMDR